MSPRRPMSVVAALDAVADGPQPDIVVLGAGAAGLTAAVFAGLRGASALVLEHSSLIGGTSATTAGTLWMPGMHATDDRSAAEDAVLAQEYLDNVIGDDALAAVRRRFVREGAQMIDELQQRTAVAFSRRSSHPDYLGDVAGASTAGRAIEVVDFDGLGLGDDLRHLRPPLAEFTIFRGLAPSREELSRYSVIAARPWSPTAWGNAFRATPRIARHVRDLLAHRRTSRLTLGNALIGRLMASLQHLGTARVVLSATTTRIIREPDGIAEVHVSDAEGASVVLRPRRALMIATGGFSRGPRRGALLDDHPRSLSAVAPGSDGSAHDLLHAVGAAFSRQGSDAFWAPVSLVPSRDGGNRILPHFALDRGRPGTMIVDGSGQRFASEAAPYHLLGEQMRARAERQPSHLIADHTAIHRYGLGAVRPGGWGISRRLRDGYLTRGRTLDELAERLGLPPGVLRASVNRFNLAAELGKDAEHDRGGDAYQAALGDAGYGPNPSLGALLRPPFYAIRLYPGDIGSASGFATDDRARALDEQGQAIPGLYVLGADMLSIMGGAYPGPGITLGPAMVFAGIAVRDALKDRR